MYALMATLKAHVIILVILAGGFLFELLTMRASIFNHRAYPKTEIMLRSLVNVFSFAYLMILFITLLVDGYVLGNAPDSFYFFYWLIVVYPLFFGVHKLLRLYFSQPP